MDNRIIKMEPVEWRKLKWLQNKNLKEMSKKSFEKLKASLIGNNFIQPFNVWQDGEEIWILDGHHRERVLREIESEGHKVPDLLPANFVTCANRKEAVKLILVYSSIYARVTEDGLYEMLNLEGLSMDDIRFDIELPALGLERFGEGYFGENQEGSPGGSAEKGSGEITCPNCGHHFVAGG